MRSLLLVFILTVIPALGHAQDSTNQDSTQGLAIRAKSRIRKNVTVVSVLFNVKDKHNALVPNLAKEQFELFKRANHRPSSISPRNLTCRSRSA